MMRDKLKEDMRVALKAREADRLRTLRLLNAVVLNEEKKKRVELKKEDSDLEGEELRKKMSLTDEELQSVIMSEVKKRKDSIEEFQKGDREDLVDKEEAELEILYQYLPEQMSDDEIKEVVEEVIEDVGENIGDIMKEAMKRMKGKTEGGLVSEIAKEIIND